MVGTTLCIFEGVKLMAKRVLTEEELLKELTEETAHADLLADLLPQELPPLERLKGSVKRYVRPTDPVWDEFFESNNGATDDFMESRDQPKPGVQDK